MHRENVYNHAEKPKITLLITATSLQILTWVGHANFTDGGVEPRTFLL